jgi:pimeloyl-ACP methyl ester carboxylesterase
LQWIPIKTIFIQHGFGRSSAFWYKWIPVLVKQYCVIRRDALSHGYSSGAPKDHPKTIEVVASEIIDNLDQLKIDKVHHLGESTTGIFASFLGAKMARSVPQRGHMWQSSLPLPSCAKNLSFGCSDPVTPLRQLGARKWDEKFIKLSATDEGVDKGFLAWYLE